MYNSNNLGKESSIYLQQHKEHAIHWQPWSEEVFLQAQELNKPVFLSIGYSSCHWCHVMSHECFENSEIADILNNNFVSIKVDKEERPDIDNIYMSVCQMLNGSGGWPMSLFLTPDKKVFWAGTYLPKDKFLQLSTNITNLWNNQPEKILGDADNIYNGVTKYYKHSIQDITQDSDYNSELYNQAWEKGFSLLKNSFDKKHGGFGHSPKFPIYSQLSFLIHYLKHTNNNSPNYQLAHNMLSLTLQNINLGGIKDHIGGGFHRYTIDRAWQIPHFEKILSDQALLTLIYSDSLLDNSFNHTIQEALNYLEQDMVSNIDNNLYCNSQDAGLEEGVFYTWTADELQILLEPQELDFLIQYFDAQEQGNYLDERTREYNGKNILYLSQELSKGQQEEFTSIKEKLYKHRIEKRELLTDNKALTGPNILALIAQLKHYSLQNDIEQITLIENKLQHILNNYSNNNYELIHSKDTKQLFLDNYSYLIWLLIELYQATAKSQYLELALQYTNKAISLFWKEEQNIFVYHSNNELFLQQTEIHDSVIPAGNSIMLMNLTKLSTLNTELGINKHIEKMLAVMEKSIKEYTSSHLYWLQAYKIYDNVIKITAHSQHAYELVTLVQKELKKDNIIMEYNNDLEVNQFIICQNNTCQPAYNSIQELKSALNN